MDYYSLSDIKKKNYNAVFQYIYQNAGSSKQQIANALNISLPTVTQHLGTLLEENLIRESGRLKSAVGRKAMSYEIVSDYRIAIGIELLAECIYIVVIDLYGHKIAKERIPIVYIRDDVYFEILKDHVLRFIERHNICQSQLLGIGIAIQGLVSQDGQSITYGKILDTEGIKIDRFSRYFDVPCHFFHDSVCAATSELWENPGLQDAIYISLSRHLGGAIIFNHKVLQGLSGKTGTFEHMTLVPGGRLCYCGKLGCADAYCSAKALIPTGMELDDFFIQKTQGNKEFQKRWRKYLDYLTIIIDNVRTVMEIPVILGGHITPHITENDITYLKERLLELSTFKDSVSCIYSGKCRVDGTPIGAALTYINNFLETLAA